VSPKTATQVLSKQPEAAGVIAESPSRVSSESLLGNRGELLIVHNGREYRLRLTQNGKLILTA
jgi:hemin uptake protein HemP